MAFNLDIRLSLPCNGLGAALTIDEASSGPRLSKVNPRSRV